MSNYPKNFSREEFIRSATAIRNGIDNSPESEAIEKNLIRLAWSLQIIRNAIKEKTGKEMPISVTSGYRCKKLNTIVTGNRHSASRHRYGLAADIVVLGMTPYETATFIRDNMPDFEFHKIINEFGAWVHVSITHENERPIKRFLTASGDSDKGVIWRVGVFDV